MPLLNEPNGLHSHVRGQRVCKLWIPRQDSRMFPPSSPKRNLKCIKTEELTTISLFGPCLGSMWPLWLPHGAKADPFGDPAPPSQEPNGRHGDRLWCPWSRPGSPTVPKWTHLVTNWCHFGSQLVPQGGQLVPQGGPRGTKHPKTSPKHPKSSKNHYNLGHKAMNP